MHGFKGNMHTHTARSDGDIDLEGVITWYAARGYDWLAITDHNLGLDADKAAELSAKHKILVIPGIEITGTGHVVGLNITKNCAPADFCQPALQNSLQAGVDWIRDRGGVPILAHPNWGTVFGADVMAALSDCHLFEVYNGSPDSNNFAAGGYPGTDEIWNETLNLGARYFGLGSDDAHQFLPEKFHTLHASLHGGECATYVACRRLTIKSVLAALEAGHCVASSGAHPVRAGLFGANYIVEVDDPCPYFHFTTEFIGPDGVVASAHGRQVSCRFPKGLNWLRARVFCSSGKYVWTQPVWH